MEFPVTVTENAIYVMFKNVGDYRRGKIYVAEDDNLLDLDGAHALQLLIVLGDDKDIPLLAEG